MPRLKSLWLSLSELSRRFDASESLHVASDFDGTLIPIADHPDRAEAPERAREVLQRLAAQPDVSLALISGRRLDDLEQRFEGVPMFLAGASGLESRDEHGRRQVHVPAGSRLPDALRLELEGWCLRFPGSRVEDKRSSCTLHYRAVAAPLQPAFGAGVRRRIRPFQEQARLVHGRRAFEVLPAASGDKSAALASWLEGRDPGGTLFYFGDDTIDEPVHRSVRERGGISVAVGRMVSVAEYALASPTEVVWFLEWLEREWSARAGAGELVVARESAGG